MLAFSFLIKKWDIKEMVGITDNIMRSKAIRNVIISAFILRLFMLGLILIWPNMAEGFIGGVEYDDVRYLTGAEY